ncbi:hypothetical protein [Nostoc sp. PCC 9305]
MNLLNWTGPSDRYGSYAAGFTRRCSRWATPRWKRSLTADIAFWS